MALALAVGAWAASANPVPIEGNPNAAVRVIIYQDLQCPECARWHGILQSQIIPEYGKRVAFVFRDFPLNQHPWSFNAAVLARFFDSKRLAWGMEWRDYCFTHQDEITAGNLLAKAAQFAAPLGISRSELDQVFFDNNLVNLVLADRKQGEQDHINHTPTVLVNGVEATTPDQLKTMLDQALHSNH